MARVNTVLKAQKSPGKCRRDGVTIEAGEKYFWAKPGYHTRTRTVWCAKHYPKASELTTSMRGEALAAQEAFDDALGQIVESDTDALEQITAEVEALGEALRQYAEQRREGADAWENGNSQMEELAEQAETAADEVEGFEVEEWDGDVEARDSEELDADEDRQDEVDQARADWEAHVQSQIEAASELSAGLDL